jgi:hypothetical protein
MANDTSKAAQMSALITAWRSSGVSKKDFCISSNLNLHTFNYWLDKERVTSVSGAFIELGGVSTIFPLDLHFPQGAVLRLGGTLSEEQLFVVKSLLYPTVSGCSN